MKKMRLTGSAILLFAMTVFMSACLDSDVDSEYTQLLKEMQAINAYLYENPPAAGNMVIYDPSGVVIVISQVGTGELPPNLENQVFAAYSGRILANGELSSAPFDSNDNYALKLKDMIDGWKIGMGQLTQGAVAKLYIPSFYGYGRNGSGSIPGNATLVFDVHLISVNPTTAQASTLESQVEAIDDKLEELEVENVVQLESGIRIVHTEQGVGDSPTLYDQVTMNITGKLLADQTVFAPQAYYAPTNGQGGRVVNYVHGMVLGLQEMKVGGKATIYVPAILAYGAEARTGIPANSNLIFEVELLSIVNP